jgi:hypothetical protein
VASWQSPANFTGRVRFRATLVEDYKTYWKDVVSPLVIVDRGVAMHTTQQNSTEEGGRRISR